MPASVEVQSAAIEKFISGWRKWTPKDMLASFSADCTQTALPSVAEKKTHSRAELDQLFPVLMSTLSNFQATQGKAAIYAATMADTPFMPYHNEQAVFIWINESGEVSKIEEMFDSAFMADFMPRFQQHIATSKEST